MIHRSHLGYWYRRVRSFLEFLSRLPVNSIDHSRTPTSKSQPKSQLFCNQLASILFSIGGCCGKVTIKIYHTIRSDGPTLGLWIEAQNNIFIIELDNCCGVGFRLFITTALFSTPGCAAWLQLFPSPLPHALAPAWLNCRLEYVNLSKLWVRLVWTLWATTWGLGFILFLPVRIPF